MTLGSIILATFLVSLVSVLAGLLLIWQKKFAAAFSFHLIGLAAGVLLSSAILDILPEAFKAGKPETLFPPLLLGIVGFFFLEGFVAFFHHHEAEETARPAAILVLIGDGLHNVFDGIAIAASFLVSPVLGWTTTVAIASHEIPHELADFLILINGGFTKGRALLFNFLSALTAFAGALGGFFFLEKLESWLSPALAFTAGTFIYIACSDLIPNLHHNLRTRRSWGQPLSFLLGIVFMSLLINFFA